VIYLNVTGRFDKPLKDFVKLIEKYVPYNFSIYKKQSKLVYNKSFKNLLENPVLA
jgi:hypothetical protein